MKLSVKALALSSGIFWGLCLFLCTLLAVYTGYLQEVAQLFEGIYPYYAVTMTGSVIGLVWGFVDGFIVGLIFGWLYNRFAPSGV
ncbi:hypothetical protein GF369_00345 [Candidatus Peregrinibacteria bacterium]|nr:hypothetical protein [Candidatus Peregrinibacteria bacterium]